MSKKNKVVKLGSKNRSRGRKGFVVFNGVEMTRAEREAFLRAQSNDRADDAKEVKAPKLKKGTKVAEPRHSKLFNLLHPNRKQTEVPNLKSVDISVYNKAKPVEAAPPVAKEEPVEELDDITAPITVGNAKKRISPSFVKRVGTVSAKSCDELMLEEGKIEEEIAQLEKELAKAKTPKDASDEVRAQMNAQRKALRAQRSKLIAKRDVSKEKAVALEKASDGYCEIYRLLTGNELSLRKTPRINEYVPLSEEAKQEVLDSLWAKQKKG